MATEIEHFPYPGLLVVLVLGGMGRPFPEDVTRVLCSFLIASGVVKPVPIFLVAFVFFRHVKPGLADKKWISATRDSNQF